MILGIDEVGRGPWAGPLVVGAVVFPANFTLDGLTDSKKLTAKKRIELDEKIRNSAVAWGLGWVYPDELDSVGLSESLRLATIRAVQSVDDAKATYGEIIIDGTINFLKNTTKGQYVTTLAKADYLIPAVSAASIIAKVARDAYMGEQDLLYPEYGFGSHVGYGTAKHRDALAGLGVTPLHRKSFAPIRQILDINNTSNARTPEDVGKVGGAHKVPLKKVNSTISTKDLGNRAEVLAANWLVANSYLVISRNWKTSRCEIDIIAQKNCTLYFVEVKYRSSQKGGDGFDAIAAKKLNQMHFAVEMYCAKEKYRGSSRLAVIAVDKNGTVKFAEV